MARKKTVIRWCSTGSKSVADQDALNLFHAIKDHDRLPFSEILKRSNLPNDTARKLITLYIKRKYVKPEGALFGKDYLVGFNKGYKNVLGVGFNGDKCILTILDMSGAVIRREEISIKNVGEFKGRKKEINDLIVTIGTRSKLKDTPLCTGVIAVPEKFREFKFDTAELLTKGIKRFFKCGVLLANAITAAAYGEKSLNEKISNKDVIYLYSDIGSGVIIKDETLIEPDESSTASDKTYLKPWPQYDVVALTKRFIDKGLGTAVVDMAGGKTENINFEIVMEAAKNKDELAGDLVRSSAFALGVRASYLVNTFKVPHIVLAGGIGNEEGGFSEGMKEAAKKFLLNEFVDKVHLIKSGSDKDAFSVGAALLGRRELFMDTEGEIWKK
ncbi:MAG: ROK family protein [Candidatus Omnitrophica bacterium]|nr:ROK family protein [Candidatus Omnitrophota bacterium]